MKGATKLELRRWRVTVQTDGARDAEVLVSGTWLWRESQDLAAEAEDTWWRGKASAEIFFYGNMDLFYEVNLLNNTQLEPIAKGKGT